MRRVNIKQRVLDAWTTANSAGKSGGGATSSSAGSTNSLGGKNDSDLPETLGHDHFQPCKVVRHGFPHQPTAIAYDPVQKLIAIGNKAGCIRILGQPGVDVHVSHDAEVPVIQLLFLVNEGGLISICANDSIHMWNLRQKKPGILHSLQFNKERITYCHLPYKSKWLYIGTDRGNLHFCCVETFVLSGYTINWNKAIELSQKSHPGHIVGISENPCDENKLLVAFETGLVILWDLKLKTAEHRYYADSSVRQVTWHHEGKQFMCCHGNGSLSVWNYRSATKPQQVQFPHAKTNDSSKFDSFHPVEKVEWKTCRSSEPFVIFTGGLSTDRQNTRPSVTVMRGKSVTVLEMDYDVIDFIAISQTPWQCEIQDPIILAILLEQELVVVDLTVPGYPCIEFPHPIDIHDSPVTCLQYVVDSNSDLTPGLYQVASSKQKRSSASKMDWPMDGGEWSIDSCTGFPEIIVSGHADGTIRFWDASAVSLKALYKLRTYKFFKRSGNIGKHQDASESVSIRETHSLEEDPFAISHMCVNPVSRSLVVANASSTVMACELSKQDISTELSCIEIHPANEDLQLDESPCIENASSSALQDLKSFQRQESDTLLAPMAESKTMSKSVSDDSRMTQKTCQRQTSSTYIPLLRLKSGNVKQSCGYHATLFCQFTGTEADPAPYITELQFNSAYGLIVIGTVTSLCIVDAVQKVVLMNLMTADVLSSIDHKKPKSPIKIKPPVSLGDLVQMYTSSDQNVIKSPSSEVSNSNHVHLSGSRTPHKELSVSSVTSSGNTPPGRPKKPPHRGMNKKTGSFSFEKSIDSQASFTTDDSAFSRASSITDLDRSESRDVITSITFTNTYARKGDQVTCACLCVGTSSGNVFIMEINKGQSDDERPQKPVIVSPSGTILQMKGAIISCFFLNSAGQPIVPATKHWRDLMKLAQQNSTEGCGSTRSMSPDVSMISGERHYMVITSEKQIKVLSLPAQSSLSLHTVPSEAGCILRSQVAVVQSCACLLCFSSVGNISVYSLTSLAPLCDVNYLTPNDVRIAQTLCFTSDAQAIYMPTPSEIQRLACSVEMYEGVQEIIGHLFIPCDAPERPNPGFFKGLFGGGVSLLDREELFGEAHSGKASRAVAKHIPGSGGASLEGLRGAAQHGLSEMQKLRLAALERGEKLGELEEKTQRMQESAMKFSVNAHMLMLKQKNKKWYQL